MFESMQQGGCVLGVLKRELAWVAAEKLCCVPLGQCVKREPSQPLHHCDHD